MAGAGVCSTTVLLLLLAVAVTISGALDKITSAVQATDNAAGSEETSELLPVHHSIGEKKKPVNKLAAAGGRVDGASGDVAASLPSTEDGKMVGSGWGKAKKMDDDDDDDDDKGDSDHDHDHDSDSDHDHDSDHDSDSDCDHDSNDNHDDDDDDDSKHGRKKKHWTPGRKEDPGGKHDDELPKVVIKT